MKKILTIAAVIAFGVAAYAISAANENQAEGSSAAKGSCCAGRKAVKTAEGAALCQKGAGTATADASRTPQGKEVTLTGRVLCERCDLHLTAACTPTLKAEGHEGYLRICPASKDITALEKAGDVEVKGYVRPGADGRDEIEVVSFNKRPSKT